MVSIITEQEAFTKIERIKNNLDKIRELNNFLLILLEIQEVSKHIEILYVSVFCLFRILKFWQILFTTGRVVTLTSRTRIYFSIYGLRRGLIQSFVKVCQSPRIRLL